MDLDQQPGFWGIRWINKDSFFPLSGIQPTSDLSRTHCFSHHSSILEVVHCKKWASNDVPGWYGWGNQAEEYDITWRTYRHNSQVKLAEPPEGIAAAQQRLL